MPIYVTAAPGLQRGSGRKPPDYGGFGVTKAGDLPRPGRLGLAP